VSQPDDDIRPDTVGFPLPGVSVKVNEIGEILVRGGSITKGYYRNPEATSTALKDGWLHTGDYGYIENTSGHLIMLDRMKDIMTLNKGMKFSPQAIETKLKFSPYIKESICFGDGKDYISSLIQIDMDNVGKWAEQNNVPYTTFKDLSQRTEVYRLIEKEVKKTTSNLPDDLKVVRFSLFDKELDPEDDEITHTRKVRRFAINERYEHQIEALYRDDECDIHIVRVS
jgi:long-chain acyl-CoA synthetase